ncbi:restriction endonuclease [Paraburkholderia rhynchosiae]|nr:restriction endonuclease [Paraburkholderia rhynchosiae]CAB3665630.1 hypothetical protein LMG27174_01866 [Paraburkholderia rhynchosiae]
MSSKDWLKLEELVARIQKQLAPEADVQHNVHLLGRITERERQIDILVRQKIGQYEMSIVIDCKDYKKPVDTKGVEEFYGLVSDVGAHKGVLVCPAGFSVSAKKTAKHRQIELYRPIDTDDHKWRVKAAIPVVCDFRSAAMSFGISSIAAVPIRISQHPADFEVFTSAGDRLDSPLKTASTRWNNGDLPTDVGDHEGLLIYPGHVTQIDNGYGTLIPVTLTVGLRVTSEVYFGQLDIERISGFLDEHTGLVVTNSFTTGGLSPEEIESRWKKLSLGDAPPIRPVLRLQGLTCWGTD